MKGAKKKAGAARPNSSRKGIPDSATDSTVKGITKDKGRFHHRVLTEEQAKAGEEIVKALESLRDAEAARVLAYVGERIGIDIEATYYEIRLTGKGLSEVAALKNLNAAPGVGVSNRNRKRKVR